jgi:hypothetical protein
MTNVVAEFYRCPKEFTEPEPRAHFHPVPLNCAHTHGAAVSEDVDISTAVNHLRRERYVATASSRTRALLSSDGARWLYYQLRPALSDSFRHSLQRLYLRDWSRLSFPQWPVDTSVEDLMEGHLRQAAGGQERSIPFIWFWPDGASSAAIMTHDVETAEGLALVPKLMDVDDEFGVKSSFQLVPEQRYLVSRSLLETIRKRQCEVNLHGLNHDGNLFRDRNTFLQQCARINHYLKEYDAAGFRSACMYRNMDWYSDLDISFDMSVPNVAHLEPQRGGCCTVFPYFVGNILELPLTTIQDYSLMNILGDYSIDLWKRQIEIVMARHGLLSFIVHPDYIFEERSVPVYKKLLGYLSGLMTERHVWLAPPGEVNRWWRDRSAMKLVRDNGMWRVEGPARERARIGVARIEGGRVVYQVGSKVEAVGALESEAHVP